MSSTTSSAWLDELPKCPACGKCAHPTQASAEAHKVILERTRGASRLHVYRCPGAGAYHVGHDRKQLNRDLANALRAGTAATKASRRPRRR